MIVNIFQNNNTTITNNNNMIVYSFVKIIQTEKFSKSEKKRKRKKIYKDYANINKYNLNNDLKINI